MNAKRIKVMRDDLSSESKADGPLHTNGISDDEVPVIQLNSINDTDEDNVQYIKLEDNDILKYSDGVVTLSDGTQWFKIPLSEVKIEDSEDIKTVLEVSDDSESIEVADEYDNVNEETSEISTRVVLLEDGKLAYIQPVFTEEDINENENTDAVEEQEVLSSEDVPSKLLTKKKRKKHVCKVPGCFKSYTSLHHLKIHYRNHAGVRPFKCTIEGCTKAFLTHYSRKAHIRTHTGEKPYLCPSSSCSKSFKTSGDLQKHIRIHTGERPFVCPVQGCNKSFTTSNIRKVHIRTHTGEKPYVCTHEGCSRSFASSTNYKNHLRIHSGEKPYVCAVPDCMRRFTEYSSLYKHQLVHSQVKKHVCPFCQKTYRQSSTLTTHKRTIHGVISAEDGTELILEQMIGIGEDGSKNFKNLTSKLLNLKRGQNSLVSIDDDPLYIVTEFQQETEEDFEEDDD